MIIVNELNACHCGHKESTRLWRVPLMTRFVYVGPDCAVGASHVRALPVVNAIINCVYYIWVTAKYRLGLIAYQS